MTDVSPIDRGVNALYRLGLADGDRAVMKVPRYASETAFLVEPALLERIGRDTGVPVPRVLGRATGDSGPLGLPFYVMAHVDGRDVDTVLSLSPTARERLVRTAATHLAAIHRLSPSTTFGHLHAHDGNLVASPSFDAWWPLFASLADDVADSLLGDGPLADDEPQFADLEPAIRSALTGRLDAVNDASPPRSFVFREYRPSNLVLAPGDDAEPLVRGVLDVSGLVGDALLDVARTEDALVDLPLGGTGEAASLRDTFRGAYAAARDADRPALFDERYPRYRLYARTFRLKAFDYSLQFARESDPGAAETRWRSFVDDRLEEIRG